MDPINSANPPSYPINKALSAYGKNPRINKAGGMPFASNITGVRRSTPTDHPLQATPPTSTRQTDPVGKIAPSPMAQRAQAIGQLVGAKVQPINLSNDVAQDLTQVRGPKPTVTSAGTYTMYPQAADRVQAATGLAANMASNLAANLGAGRSLDIRG